MTRDFDCFIAVDWSGAKGEFLKGLSVAICEPGTGAPRIIPPPRKYWSRVDVMDTLNDVAKSSRVLCGFDFSFSAPFLDKDSFFPNVQAKDAPNLWQEVEAICRDDAHLSCASFTGHPDLKDLFLTPQGRGSSFEARLRLCEALCRDKGLGRAESLFHLVGPSQVGLASLTGMRALLRLENYAIWPFNRPANGSVANGSVAVEIFTRLFLTRAGAGAMKITRLGDLNTALETIGSKPVKRMAELDDHKADAIVSAAGLRQLANSKAAWKPREMSENVRKTEGWTFGVF